jgi:putative NADPH-quinone reductase
MKVVTILGSPRIDGNTETVLKMVEDELVKKGHEVDRVNVTEYELDGCYECFMCKENPDDPHCAKEDDVDQIFRRMKASDVILLASPLFCWDFPAQMKPIFDRSLCMVDWCGSEKHKSRIEGRGIALLVTCAGPVEDNADCIQTVFERYARWTKTNVKGKWIVPFCSEPSELPAGVSEKAKQFASEITAG